MTLGQFAASSRSGSRLGRQLQVGVAVVLAMLTLSVLTLLAAAVAAQYGVAIEFLAGRQDQEQTRWLARGAVDWARNVLAEDARTSDIDYFGEDWATRVPPTPVEDGEVSGEIQDLSGRFDLNSLVANGKQDAKQVEAYLRLLVVLGQTPRRAVALAATLVDWLDADEDEQPGGAESSTYLARSRYRAANGPLVDVDELTLLAGYEAALIAQLRPHVVALPARAPVNVNTATPEVLSAILPGLTIDDARIVLAGQDRKPFVSVDDFVQHLPRAAVPAARTGLAVGSRFFLVVGRAKYGKAVTRMQVFLDRGTRWPLIVWQKLL